MRISAGALALAILLAPSRARAQQPVEDQIRPSVVQIRNDECFGSGMFLDTHGLILTNAHVACSPLPFRVLAIATIDGKPKEVTFTHVSLLGFHPEYDLALLRVDPEELGAEIKPLALAKTPPIDGERVWAVGFPSDHERGKAKVATWGEMRSANKDFYGMPYLSVDISVTHGNSGGPLCNEKGEVLGVVTASDPTGALAVPISAYKPEKFGPLKARVPNREVSSKLLNLADELMKTDGKDTPSSQAMSYYETALLWDSGNASLYSKVGQMQISIGRFPAAVAYLTRSLQMEPWPEKADPYRLLGAALAGLRKQDEALAVWREGLDKYPLDNAELWGSLAVALEKAHHPIEAAFSARVALKTFSAHAGEMTELYHRCRDELDPRDLDHLRELEGDLDAHLGRLRAAAEKAHHDGRPFMNADAERVIGTMAGVQQVSALAALDPVIESRRPEPPRIPDEEVEVRFIRGRIGVAKEYLRNGKPDKAIDILEDIVRTFPSNPETEAARLALKLVKRN
jgi:tetratricopeptide (TPR) repeat protein